MKTAVVGSRVTPPSRDGVGASCVALPPGPWLLLIDFLVQRFPAVTPSVWCSRLASGAVVDEFGGVLSVTSRYRVGAKIFYYRDLPAEITIPFEEKIVFQDAYLVVADKPHFLPVTPAGRYVQQTLLVRLKRRLGIDTLAPIHRIDRETAGLVLFSIQPNTRAAYQAMFRARTVQKNYEAIAINRPDLVLPMVVRNRLVDAESFMKMRIVDGEPNAETRIALVKTEGELARYSLQPATGQRHQLRVQMEALGMPILNDQIYPHHLPEIKAGEVPDFSKPLQLLAKFLSFTDPVTGRQRMFESERSLLF